MGVQWGGGRGILFIAGGSVKWSNQYGNQNGKFLKKWKPELLYEPAVQLLGIDSCFCHWLCGWLQSSEAFCWPWVVIFPTYWEPHEVTLTQGNGQWSWCGRLTDCLDGSWVTSNPAAIYKRLQGSPSKNELTGDVNGTQVDHLLLAIRKLDVAESIASSWSQGNLSKRCSFLTLQLLSLKNEASLYLKRKQEFCFPLIYAVSCCAAQAGLEFTV